MKYNVNEYRVSTLFPKFLHNLSVPFYTLFIYMYDRCHNYCGPNVFDIHVYELPPCKILKLDRKTPGIFFIQKSGNPVN